MTGDTMARRTSIRYGRDVRVFFDNIQDALVATSTGSSHLSIGLSEVSGFPPMIYGVTGTRITIDIPGPTPEEFLRGWENAEKGLRSQIVKMEDDGTF